MKLSLEQVEQIQQQIQHKQAQKAASSRYGKLMARMNNPKERNVLDILEYEAIQKNKTSFKDVMRAQAVSEKNTAAQANGSSKVDKKE